jgi:gamma-glutamyltranspeptidase/glutathione hydrolase
VADDGARAVYDGAIGGAIVDAVQAAGGALSLADLAGHRSEWVAPLRVRYGPWDVWQCPPNGQGLAALAALGVAHHFELSSLAWDSAERLHVLIEAMRVGFAVADEWVADPEVAPPTPAGLLSEAWTAEAAARIDTVAHPAALSTPRGSDTVYLSVVDAEGNACSLIASNYMGFGSGLVAGDTGIPLQNRGAGFTLEPSHPNVYAPRKRPFHTIMPGLATHSDGRLAASFGVMGGHMQPQGHVQLISNMLDHGLDPQRALDAPRFQLLPTGALALEPTFGLATRLELAARGHRIVAPARNPPSGTFGGGQAIIVAPNGIRSGGSDPRKDGLAIAQY